MKTFEFTNHFLDDTTIFVNNDGDGENFTQIVNDRDLDGYCRCLEDLGYKFTGIKTNEE